MGYNPFDYIGTDKRKRVSSKAMEIASDAVTEQRVRETISNLLKKELSESSRGSSGFGSTGK